VAAKNVRQGRSAARVEGLAVDLDLGGLVAAPDSRLKKFELYRPLKDLPEKQRELWHVEAIKD
jgi:hypothetical protein